jgi:hypothetical protein
MVARRVLQIELDADIALGGLDRLVTQAELDLLETGPGLLHQSAPCQHRSRALERRFVRLAIDPHGVQAFMTELSGRASSRATTPRRAARRCSSHCPAASRPCTSTMPAPAAPSWSMAATACSATPRSGAR